MWPFGGVDPEVLKSLGRIEWMVTQSLAKQDQILAKLNDIQRKDTVMAGEIDALRAEVANNTSVEQSAIALLQGLKAQLDAAIAAGDMSAVKELSDQLGQNDAALAAAVTANTPAAPAP